MNAMKAGLLVLATGFVLGTLGDVRSADAASPSNTIPGAVCHAEFPVNASQVSYNGPAAFNNSASSSVSVDCPYVYTVSGSPSPFFHGTVSGLNRTNSTMSCELFRFDPTSGNTLGTSSVTFPANMTSANTLSFAQPGGSGGNFFMLCTLPPSAGSGLNAWVNSSELSTNT